MSLRPTSFAEAAVALPLTSIATSDHGGVLEAGAGSPVRQLDLAFGPPGEVMVIRSPNPGGDSEPATRTNIAILSKGAEYNKAGRAVFKLPVGGGW